VGGVVVGGGGGRGLEEKVEGRGIWMGREILGV